MMIGQGPTDRKRLEIYIGFIHPTKEKQCVIKGERLK
jgi:hypothetical protein